MAVGCRLLASDRLPDEARQWIAGRGQQTGNMELSSI